MPAALHTTFAHLHRDQRGAVLPILAIAMVVLLGFGALAIDVGYLYTIQARLQSAADAAALAAVGELPDEDAAEAAATGLAGTNLGDGVDAGQSDAGAVAFGRWDADTGSFLAGETPADAVRVTLGYRAAADNAVPTFFAGFLGHDEVDVEAQSIARAHTSDACFWSLHPSAEGAVRIESNADVVLDNCGFTANSSHARGMWADSGGCIEASRIEVVGGADGSCYDPEPETGAAPLTDPLADLEAPSVGSCDETSEVLLEEGGTYTLTPGVYCGGIRVGENASVTFASGLYVLGGIGLKVEEGSTVEGDGVTFYLTFGDGSWGTVHIEDDSTVTVTAPDSGPLAGIAFFQDRDTPAGERFLVEDVSAATIDGTIYVPSIQLWFETNGSLDTTGLVIADRMTFEANARVHRTGDAVSLRTADGGSLVR